MLTYLKFKYPIQFTDNEWVYPFLFFLSSTSGHTGENCSFPFRNEQSIVNVFQIANCLDAYNSYHIYKWLISLVVRCLYARGTNCLTHVYIDRLLFVWPWMLLVNVFHLFKLYLIQRAWCPPFNLNKTVCAVSTYSKCVITKSNINDTLLSLVFI